jgi:hypothetical protein
VDSMQGSVLGTPGNNNNVGSGVGSNHSITNPHMVVGVDGSRTERGLPSPVLRSTSNEGRFSSSSS